MNAKHSCKTLRYLQNATKRMFLSPMKSGPSLIDACGSQMSVWRRWFTRESAALRTSKLIIEPNVARFTAQCWPVVRTTALFDRVWPRLTAFDCVWPRLIAFDRVWPRLIAFDRVQIRRVELVDPARVGHWGVLEMHYTGEGGGSKLGLRYFYTWAFGVFWRLVNRHTDRAYVLFCGVMIWYKLFCFQLILMLGEGYLNTNSICDLRASLVKQS